MTWWRHQMEIFSTLLAICAGNSPVPGEFPAQRPVTWSFDVFFDMHPNKRLSKQQRGWWFETLSCPLRLHRNECGCRRPNNTTRYQAISRHRFNCIVVQTFFLLPWLWMIPARSCNGRQDLAAHWVIIPQSRTLRWHKKFYFNFFMILLLIVAYGHKSVECIFQLLSF